MAAKVKLDAIVGELEISSDNLLSFVDRETGEVLGVTRDVLDQADADPELPDGMPEWEIRIFEDARRILQDPSRFPGLPDQFEVDEYSIMAEFCDSVQNDRLRDELFDAIRGKGAFRRFKDVLSRRKLWDHWSTFKTEALREIAKDWCEEHKIEYV